MSIITIVGAGMMGSAMSGPAADNGHEIRLVGTPLDREIIDSVRKTGFHPALHKQLRRLSPHFRPKNSTKRLKARSWSSAESAVSASTGSPNMSCRCCVPASRCCRSPKGCRTGRMERLRRSRTCSRNGCRRRNAE